MDQVSHDYVITLQIDFYGLSVNIPYIITKKNELSE